MFNRLIFLPILLILFSVHLSALEIRLNGFATIAAGMTDEKDDVYHHYDDELSFSPDSVLGLQLDAELLDKLSGTFQLMACENYVDDDFQLEWAYLTYDYSSDFRLLLGRIRPSMFLYSSYLDVGYAYLWVSPPQEMYSFVPLTNIDGINLSYNHVIGDYELSLTGWLGDKKKIRGTKELTFKLNHSYIAGGEIALSHDFAKFRVSYARAKLTANLKNILLQPNKQLLSIYENRNTPAEDRYLLGLEKHPEIQFNDSLGQFLGFGMHADYKNIIFISEYIRRFVKKTAFPDLKSWYTTLAYRIGDFTPHFTYSSVKTNVATYTDREDAVLESVVNNVLQESANKTQSVTLGVRYKVNSSAVLKAEWISTNVDIAGSVQPLDGKINTFKLGLSIIF